MKALELAEILLKLAQNSSGGGNIEVVISQQGKSRKVSGVKGVAIVNAQTGKLVPHLEIQCERQEDLTNGFCVHGDSPDDCPDCRH